MTAAAHDLAGYGAAVLATLTFDRDWGGDTFEALKDVARAQGLSYGDQAQAREFCALYGLDPVTLGDDAPAVEFGSKPSEDVAGVRAAFHTWHDAKNGDSNDAEHQAAADLIDALAAWGGIEITEC